VPLKGARILVLGIAYKKDVDGNRESPALKVIQLLSKEAAIISYKDPHLPRCTGCATISASTWTLRPLRPERSRRPTWFCY
jgi:UDP-N-acetyl-D-mannosaminuronate dehydrogenase